MSYVTHVKSVLENLIDEFELKKSNYCKNPEKDFNVTSIFDRIAEKKNQMGDKELDIKVIPDKKKQQVL
ncbi:MAG: hypothetical protein IJ065_06240 [Eubacterium sp.]|nr:hypothetical protein [Eubacterium sp.]